MQSTFRATRTCKLLSYVTMQVLMTSTCLEKSSASELGQQRCSQNNNTTVPVNANIVYTGLSFMSFLAGCENETHNHYGPSDYACWISQYDESCNDSEVGLIEQASLFYFWALAGAALLTVVAVMLSLILFRQSSRRCTATSCTIIVMTALLSIAVMVIGTLFVFDVRIGQHNVPLSQPWLVYLQAICIPSCMTIINVALFVRTCYLGHGCEQHCNVSIPLCAQRVKHRVLCPHEATPMLSTISTHTPAELL
ncbi:hypothetical protein EMCRGX_G024214 [Ephydatia muelleri]